MTITFKLITPVRRANWNDGAFNHNEFRLGSHLGKRVFVRREIGGSSVEFNVIEGDGRTPKFRSYGTFTSGCVVTEQEIEARATFLANQQWGDK